MEHDYLITKLAKDDFRRLIAIREGLPSDAVRNYSSTKRGICYVVRDERGEPAGFLLAYTAGKRGVCTDLVIYAPHDKEKLSQMLIRALFESTATRVDYWSLPNPTYNSGNNHTIGADNSDGPVEMTWL
jgi:hypothetical protein